MTDFELKRNNVLQSTGANAGYGRCIQMMQSLGAKLCGVRYTPGEPVMGWHRGLSGLSRMQSHPSQLVLRFIRMSR